jgi:hypothetical protein
MLGDSVPCPSLTQQLEEDGFRFQLARADAEAREQLNLYRSFIKPSRQAAGVSGGRTTGSYNKFFIDGPCALHFTKDEAVFAQQHSCQSTPINPSFEALHFPTCVLIWANNNQHQRCTRY